MLTAAHIEARTREVEREIESLKSELQDLAAALRTIQRMAPVSITNNVEQLNPKDRGMTINAMILKTFSDKSVSSILGMTPEEVRKHIFATWHREVKSTDVGPAMWKLWKAGKLTKDMNGPSYYAIENPAEAGSPKELGTASPVPGPVGGVPA